MAAPVSYWSFAVADFISATAGDRLRVSVSVSVCLSALLSARAPLPTVADDVILFPVENVVFSASGCALACASFVLQRSR